MTRPKGSKNHTKRIKNWGQRERKVTFKKTNRTIPRSQFVLNLSEEAKNWAELGKRLRKRIRGYNV